MEIHNTNGKPWVYFSGYKRNVASVVIKAFVEDKSLGQYKIGYKDGNMENCRADNLYWIQKGSDLVSGPVGKGAADDQSIIDLWTAMLDLAIRDLWYGQNPRSGADRLHANEAKFFFQKAYWFYLGEDPDPTTMKAIARRVAEFDDNRYKSGRVRVQKKVPDVQVPLVGSGHSNSAKDDNFGGSHFLRLHACNRQEERTPWQGL